LVEEEKKRREEERRRRRREGKGKVEKAGDHALPKMVKSQYRTILLNYTLVVSF